MERGNANHLNHRDPSGVEHYFIFNLPLFAVVLGYFIKSVVGNSNLPVHSIGYIRSGL